MSVAVVRRPSVAGFYYPEEAEALRRTVEQACAPYVEKTPYKAMLVPSSPYQRCGQVSAAVWAQTEIPRKCVLLGPSLTGSWMPWSLLTSGAYRTPLGEVPVDSLVAEALARACPFLETDAWGQTGEHAAEVQLPFAQVLGPEDLSCVPLLIGSPDTALHQRLAEGLAAVILSQAEPVLLVVSSDLAQFEPELRVREKDQAVLQSLCAVDAEQFQAVVKREAVQMQGFAAVNVALQAAKLLGSERAKILSYDTNVTAGGDPFSAVGYAGLGWA